MTKTETQIRIDTKQIPRDVKDRLASSIVAAAERFYADPENMRAFEAWLAERNK